MAKTGRKPLEMPRTRWTVYIREDLAAKVELIILDPMREKAKYGARTAYLESLIEKDLRERQRAQAEQPVVDAGNPPSDGQGNEPDSGGPTLGGINHLDPKIGGG